MFYLFFDISQLTNGSTYKQDLVIGIMLTPTSNNRE